MADPVGVAIAFDDDALDTTPTWTRLDDPDGYRLVDGWTIRRGRQSELERTGTGTANISFVDLAGLLDPTNAGSPFAGKLDPGKQAAIVLFNPVTETWGPPLIRGHTSEWQGEWDITARLQRVSLEIEDGFGFLSGLEMTPGQHGDTAPIDSQGDIYFEETSGVLEASGRIVKALDDAGWPAAWRRLFTFNVDLQATTYARLDEILSVCLDAADAEFPGVGNVYCSKDGHLTAHGRYARFTPHVYEAADDASRSAGNSICFWNVGSRDVADADPTVAPISGLAWRRSRNDIINACICLPAHVEAADVPGSLVKDDASILQYGWRQVSFEGLLTLHGNEGPPNLTAVEETKLYATYFVANYKTPHTRVTKLVLRSRDPSEPWAAALWELLCGIDIGDVIHLETTHFAGVAGFDEDFYVEGIGYTAKPFRAGAKPWPDLTLELDVSPALFYATNPF